MRVSITVDAAKQFEMIADYLEHEWSPRVRDNFIGKFESAVQVISKMPNAFPASERHSGIRKCVIHKFTSIYYRIAKDEIQILAVTDNRSEF